MNRDRTKRKQLLLLGAVAVVACPVLTRGEDAWISFVKSPTSISATNEVIFDLPCDASCTLGCARNSAEACPGNPVASKGGCACEKDLAVGDLDGRLPLRDDLVIVRIQPFFTGGGVSNLLFLNINGVMVDSTDLVEGFADLTADRDVVIVDVDFDLSSNLNMPDVVTAAAFGEQPRVYMNLGCCNTACSPSNPCAPANMIQCASAANWCGLKYDATENRITFSLPPGSSPPSFLGVAAGDVNMDDCDDLYFTASGAGFLDVEDDRLLFNIKDAQTGACTGIFEDVTEDPPTRLCPPGASPCFNESRFATGAQIIDMNLDFKNDIVKSDARSGAERLLILYNDANNVGHFDIMQDLEDEFEDIDHTYMFAAADMNNNGGVDIYAVDGTPITNPDHFLITQCFAADPLPDECSRAADGMVQFLPAKSVQFNGGTQYQAGNVRLSDLNGDGLPDALVTDLDVPGNSFARTLTVLHTTTDPQDPMIVQVTNPTDSANCAWNTNLTYDIAVLDINGDSKPDLWSGHGGGNQVFLWELPVDCDSNGIPDRCLPGIQGSAGGQNPVAACCYSTGKCKDTFRVCCDELGGQFRPQFSCVTYSCIQGP